jgi:RNA polymerase sigma-70 factor (ECF subfamily)
VEPDDRQLIEDARNGKQAAFRTLVERYQKRLHAMVLSMVREPEPAKDIVQDAFVKVFTHLADFHGESSFYTWLYRIAMNLCIDRARRNKRFAHVEYDEAVDHHDDGTFSVSPNRLGFDPARALADKEIRGRVMDALEQLSPNHRAVLVLREIDGLAYKEIAEVMNCSIGTVMSRLFHARKRMQEMLRNLVDGATAAAAEAAAKTQAET